MFMLSHMESITGNQPISNVNLSSVSNMLKQKHNVELTQDEGQLYIVFKSKNNNNVKLECNSLSEIIDILYN